MNNNSKLFQYIVLGLFIFFIIVGTIIFATYRSKSSNTRNVQVTIWGTWPRDTFTSFVANYFDKAGLEYQVNYVEREASTFDTDLVEALASGQGPDAIILPADLIVRYANKVYNIPFTFYPELNFKQTFIEGGELYLTGNGILALPLTVDPLVMYWNRDIFNTAGVTQVPKTWADVLALTPKLTKKDATQNIIQSTVAFGEFRNINNAKNILSTLILQAGNPIIRLNSESRALTSVLSEGVGQNAFPAVASLGFYTNFSNPVKAEYSWNRSLPNSLDVFANGDLALYFGLASEYMNIKNKNPNLNFAVATVPQVLGARTYSTYGQMNGLAIMNSTRDLAGTFSVVSALTSSAAVPYWANLFNVPSARRDILAVPNTNAIRTVFNQSAIMSKGWLDPDNVRTNAVFQDMIESYTTGRETLSGAVSTASGRLNNLLPTTQ